MKVEGSSRLLKIVTISVGIIVLLVLLINFAVNFVANRLVHSMLKPENPNVTNLYFILDVRAFPYPKITVNDLNYQYQGKIALSVDKAYLDFSLLDLFRKQLHIYSIHADKVFLNLPNFPKPEEKHQNEEKRTVLSQDKNPESQTPMKSTHVSVDKIDLNDLNIIYATKAAPIHIGTIKIDQFSSDKKQFQIAVNSAYKDQLIQGDATLRFEKGLFDFVGKFTLANNQIEVNSHYQQQHLNGQIKATFNNPQALESIIGISAQKLPILMEAMLQGSNQQLTVAPIQIQYATGMIQADFNLNTGQPIEANLTIPEQLLEQLAAGEPPQNCPLPFTATEIIKGISMNLQMIIVPMNTNQSAKKNLIQINPAGINLENGVLPPNLQQYFLSCFNYQLRKDIILKGNHIFSN